SKWKSTNSREQETIERVGKRMNKSGYKGAQEKANKEAVWASEK
ncbi:3735_t:CDS:1, partial [Ambispora leptoticha]